MSVGTILRYDDIRGYGFIAPSDGGEDVFVHANDFGSQRHLVRQGMRVEYEAEQGERGLKVASVRVLDDLTALVNGAGTVERVPRGGEDDGLCDVLTAQRFTAEVTELLIQHVPTLTAGQLAQIRQHLVEHARSHGWIEA